MRQASEETLTLVNEKSLSLVNRGGDLQPADSYGIFALCKTWHHLVAFFVHVDGMQTMYPLTPHPLSPAFSLVRYFRIRSLVCTLLKSEVGRMVWFGFHYVRFQESLPVAFLKKTFGFGLQHLGSLQFEKSGMFSDHQLFFSLHQFQEVFCLYHIV